MTIEHAKVVEAVLNAIRTSRRDKGDEVSDGWSSASVIFPRSDESADLDIESIELLECLNLVEANLGVQIEESNVTFENVRTIDDLASAISAGIKQES